MQIRESNIFIDSLESNVYNLILSGRRFTATGVTDDHVNLNVPTLERDQLLVNSIQITTTTTTTPPPSSQTFTLIASPFVNEGQQGICIVNTTGVDDGSTLYFNVAPANQFVESGGAFTINSNTGNFTFSALADDLEQGNRTGTLTVRSNSLTGPVVGTTTFLIQDVTTTTTTTPPEETTTTTTPPPAVTTTTTTTPEILPEPTERGFDIEEVLDSQCSRIVFDQNFNPQRDIYVSFQTPKLPRLLTEDGEFVMLTEEGDILIVDNVSNVTVFLADGTRDVDIDATHGSTGQGAGLISTLDMTNPNMSGHVMSMCVDFLGGYGKKDTFSNSGIRGNSDFVPNSITARLSTGFLSEYDFLSTTPVPNFNIFTTDFRTFRFVFKEHLSKIRVDFKTEENEIFETVFEADTFITMSKLVSSVKIGIASSGNENFGIKDITYSGDLA